MVRGIIVLGRADSQFNEAKSVAAFLLFSIEQLHT